MAKRARFRRNGHEAINDYVDRVMTKHVDIDTRIARHCLRAGRLTSGV